jgi:hypothetical protein
MPAPRSTARLVVDDLLADGKWRCRNWIYGHALWRIPAVEAQRAAEGARRQQRKRQSVTQLQRHREVDSTLRGVKHLVAKALISARCLGVYEKRECDCCAGGEWRRLR